MEIYPSRRFSKGVGDLSANFRRKWASPTNHCLCQKTRVIALSCGIKISAVHCLVLSLSTGVTDRQTDGQNQDISYCANIAAGAVKMLAIDLLMSAFSFLALCHLHRSLLLWSCVCQLQIKFIRTNRRAIAMMFVRLSVCLPVWDGYALWSQGAR